MMNNLKKDVKAYNVTVVTATRAEYSFLRPLIKLLRQEPKINLQILVTGTHLDKRYGYTLCEIEKDGITPDALVEIIDNDSPQGVLNTMANATSKVGMSLQELNSDLVVVLGDRYEIFAIVSACVILNIPVAHISGGDVTYGAFDDMFRHCITKMSNLHFTSCEEYRRRVIQLGEHPDTVFSVGSLSLSNIKSLPFISEEALNKELGIECKKTLLATFHPVTMETQSQNQQFLELLEALVEQDLYFTLFTKANADTGSSELNKMLDEYALQFPQKIKVVESLGVLRYMSLMKYCRAVIGNSSSGILEAPSFKIATINIGNRQKGRIQAKSIVNCEGSKSAIANALCNIPTPDMMKMVVSPYEQDDTAEKIVQHIKDFLSTKTKMKTFYDLENKPCN